MRADIALSYEGFTPIVLLKVTVLSWLLSLLYVSGYDHHGGPETTDANLIAGIALITRNDLSR
jgi:hypothetical protein